MEISCRLYQAKKKIENWNRNPNYVYIITGVCGKHFNYEPVTDKFQTRAFIELKDWKAESRVGGGWGREAEAESENSLLLLSIYWLFWWISSAAYMSSNQKIVLWYFTRDVVYLHNINFLTILGFLFIYISTLKDRSYGSVEKEIKYMTSSGIHSN